VKARDRERRLLFLDEAIARGIEAAEAGRVKPAEEVFARLEEEFKAMMTKPRYKRRRRPR
jgi:antitoxin ParD1/3/4